MELDVMVQSNGMEEMQRLAARAERCGFGGIWMTESGKNAYLSCASAVLSTSSIMVGTAVAVAFPRSPMITAGTAWELAEVSGGRFVLGLGTQVKAHVERRYSSAFAPPGPRMKEYVQAVKAILRAFQGEEKLDFAGDFYNFSLLPDQWNPGPIDHPDVAVFVSAVLPWMTRMAGEVCDGIHIHPFHSPRYVTEVQVPAVREGAARSGRDLEGFTFEIPVMTAVGANEQEIAVTREHARQMIAFYGSTRTYSSVFELHGFDGLSEHLHQKQRVGDMAGMVGLITDDILDHYIVTSDWAGLGPALVERYRGVGPSVRVMTYTANTQLKTDPDVYDKWADVAAAMRGTA